MQNLNDDCVCEVVNHLPRFSANHTTTEWYKQRMTLGLVCRAAWQTFLYHWGPESDKGKVLLRQLVLSEYGRPTAALRWVPMQCDVLRLAAMNDANYAQMVMGWPKMPENLSTVIKLVGKARFTMQGNHWFTSIAMRKSDYAGIRRTLQNIYKRRPLHTPRESLALYVDVTRMARRSRDSPDVTPRKATDATRLDELYVYSEPEKPKKPLTRSGHDLRGFLPLRQNLGVKGTLWTIRKSNFGGKSMVQYFADRVKRMKLLRAPIKRLARDLRKREKREKRKQEKAKREARRQKRKESAKARVCSVEK